MFVGLWHLQTLFGTYEQFISVFGTFLLTGNARKSLWNSAQMY